MSEDDLRDLFDLVCQLESDALGCLGDKLYDWQKRFIAKTSDYRQCLLMAANRVGKTLTGCYMDAVHLTGRYPSFWEGHRFDHPPLMWVLGYSGEKCRDVLQSLLFGSYSDRTMTGGLVPRELIVDCTPSGVPKLASEVRVKWLHRGMHGVSICQFKSYSQGQHALMGDDVDWFHIDEEPKDATIWPQVLTRTVSGDKGRGGRGVLTFTPENGRTELVIKFMDDPGAGQYMQIATWDDAPHIKDDVKEEILSAYPPYQRDMRTKGIPLMGAGLIYQFSEEKIGVEPFRIPQHWFILNGMDFGWDHPQAHVQLVLDPDTHTCYVVNAWKESRKHPYEAWEMVKYWSKDIPTAWPADGLQEKNGATQAATDYANAGWNMLGTPATHESGGNGVWVGITEIINMMEVGRFKIFSNLFPVFDEIRKYHTRSMKDGRAQIVKRDDDLLDAIRYAHMMRRFAIRICDIGVSQNSRHYDWSSASSGRDSISGY